MKSKYLFLGMTALAGAGCRQPVESVAGDLHPNIIFLLTDDQRWDALGYAGNPYIKTPNLDHLACNGVYFSNAYVTTSISCASRASILSGMYASTSGINNFARRFTPEQYMHTYPQVLRNAGYYVGFIGKFGVGNKYDGIPETFDFWRSFPDQGWYIQEGKEHLTTIQGKQIIEFLESRDAEKPFCLSVSFKAPHCQDEERKNNGDEFPIDPRDEHLYDGVVFPAPHDGTDEDYLALEYAFRHSDKKDKENEGRLRWKWRFDTEEKYQETVRKYYSLISGVDREIGLMLCALKTQGLDKNTIIIFMGDNGYYLGEHGLAGKWYSHEESVRVPLFIYDPRLPESSKGKRIDEIALNIDIAPTILGYAGVSALDSMQGESLIKLINGDKKSWRKDFFYEHTYSPKHIHIPSCEGVMTERYKLLRYFADNQEWWEMYDLKKDKYENNNVSDDKNYERRRRKLMGRIKYYRDSCKTPKNSLTN